MQVGIHANMCDTDTNHVASSLHDPFRSLAAALSGEYGGIMEHLWIDLELIETHCKADGKPRYPFRFQKRVAGRSYFGLPPSEDKFNVGHYSVRPDFELLKSLSSEQIVPYVLSLIYSSTDILTEKRKKLGEFDVSGFRSKFGEECARLGYDIAAISP